MKKDIETLTNLTFLIENSPVKNFTENLVAWDAIERLLIALGLEEVIDVDAVKASIKEFEDTLLDPNTILKDVFDFNLTETVLEFVPLVDNIPTAEQFENIQLNLVGYLPILDITGPFAFFPSHCYQEGATS